MKTHQIGICLTFAIHGIQSILVQVFFDKDGREVFRHVGFFPKAQIIAKLVEMEVK